MKIIRKFVVIFGAIILSMVSIYRTVTAPDIGAMIFTLMMAIVLMGFAFFLIFENKIKTTIFFKNIDAAFLSAEYSIDGQSWNLSLLIFYTIGGYLVAALFAWAILSNNSPYKDIQIIRYLLYTLSLIITIGVCFLTLILIKVIRKMA